jgi:hypothetical protein
VNGVQFIDYDSSGKKYVPSATFQPRFLKPNPDRHLAQLKALSDGIIDLSETWLPGSRKPVSCRYRIAASTPNFYERY